MRDDVERRRDYKAASQARISVERGGVVEERGLRPQAKYISDTLYIYICILLLIAGFDSNHFELYH